MKRNKGLYALIFIALLSFVFVFSTGCNGCNGDDNSTTAGGQSSLVTNYKWNGLKDFALKLTDENYSFDEVSVVDKDGFYYDVVVDDSNVNYGTMGEYNVKFTANGQTEQAKVVIYAQPTLTVSTKTNYSYEEIVDKNNQNSIFSSTTANDCFGNALEVAIESGNGLDGLFNVDGSVDYGTHTINLVAVDNAGQSVKQSVTINVLRNANAEPTVNNNQLTIDVADNQAIITISLKNKELMGVSLNGAVLSTNDFSINQSSSEITISLANVSSLNLGNDNTIKLMTAGGYFEKTISVVDQKPAQMDVSGREEQTATVGETVMVVQPRKVYEKQNYDIIYTLRNPSGNTSNITSKSFVVDQTGVYTLTATAKRNNVSCGEVSVNYNVHHIFNDFSTSEKRSGVLAYKSVYYSESCGVASSFAYEENATIGGRTGNFMFASFYKMSYLGFDFPTEYDLEQLKALKNQGVREIFTYIYCVCQSDKSLQGGLIKVGALDDKNISATEKIGDSIKIQPRTWTRLSVSLDAIISNYNAIKSGSMKFFNIYNGGDGLDSYEEELKVYFTPILFGLPN